MYKLDLTREHAVIIGDSFGPMPMRFNRPGFDWTDSIIKFEVYRADLDAPIFEKSITWTNTDPDVLAFDIGLTPVETMQTRKGEYKYKVIVEWPNGTDKNTIIGGIIEFKKI